jgi:hypothetical protein
MLHHDTHWCSAATAWLLPVVYAAKAIFGRAVSGAKPGLKSRVRGENGYWTANVSKKLQLPGRHGSFPFGAFLLFFNRLY